MARKLGRGLGEDTHFIKRGKFEMNTAKIYIVVLLIIFHILPLVFVFMGETGLKIMMNMFLFTLNTIAIFAIGLFYGVRVGYNFKFPLVMTAISILSYVFYYNSAALFENYYYYIMSGVIAFIVYALFSFVSTAIGGWAKRFF